MERTYEAPSNEAPHMILGYHQGRLVTYLQFGVFFGIAWGQAQNPTHNVTQFAALLSQSGINVGHLRLVQLQSACFRIQFLPDHIMIHSYLVCVLSALWCRHQLCQQHTLSHVFHKRTVDHDRMWQCDICERQNITLWALAGWMTWSRIILHVSFYIFLFGGGDVR